MKYYTYGYETDLDIPEKYVTLSEEEILKEYWVYWYNRMCYKFGKEIVDRNYSSADCIDDWVTSHWAWESTDET